MNGDTSPKTPPTPRMERSSATVTRRPSTAQPSSTSTTTRTKLKPSASTLRSSNGASRPTAASNSPVAPSPTPTATSSIRRGVKSQDGTTLTASASRRTSTPSASLRSAASPVPTQSSALSRRSTTATPTSTATLGRTAPTSTLSRRATSASTVTSTASTTRRKSTLSSSSNGSSPGTPTPSISRRIGVTPTSTSSVTSSSRTSSSSTATKSPASPPTTIEEEDDDPLSLIQSEIDTLTDQLKTMEQQITDTQDRILTSQTEIDRLHKVLDDAQSQQEERLLESIVDMTEQLKEQETTRDEALAQLTEWQAQAQAQTEMVRQLEEMEVAYRDEMETLRDTLQNENDQLEISLKGMAKKVDELEESSGSLREEIQGMHKSHQARMTTLSNQLHQEHSEEWNALVQTLDKKLEEKQNSSEWADVASKRKEMVDLERSIQALEEKSAGMDEEFTRHQAELKMDLTAKLEAIIASHENEITDVSNHHKNQMAELEAECSDQIASIKSRHQSDIDASSSLSALGNNDDLKKMTMDIQADLEAEHERKLQTTRQELESRFNLVQSQLDDMVNQLEMLKEATSQEHDLKKQSLELQLSDKRTLMITQLETDFASKLDALMKTHQTALHDHRIQLEQQDHVPRVDSLKIEHSQIHSALVDEHDRKVLEMQASVAAGVRASTERQVRAEFETDIAILTRNHQQALEDLQTDHRVATKAFEESLEKAKQAHQAIKGTPSLQQQDRNEDSALERSENDNIELIRAQIQASLNQVHAAAIAKHVAEHESRLGEMKRNHILQKDRTLEKMGKEFDSQVNDIKSQNAQVIHSTQQEHDNYISDILATSKDTLVEKQAELTNQHQAVKDQLRQAHLSQIQSSSEELDRHIDQRKALDHLQTQVLDELAAFKISSTKELQDRKMTMDDNAIKIKAHLEETHNTKLDDLKAKHQETLDTLLAEYQHDIESQSQHISPQPDMEDALADNYKEQIEQFILEQESKAATLLDTLNRLREQNTALENEQQSQLHASKQEWIARLKDATQSAEQLTETTLLNEPIRTHMHGEAKKSHDDLVAAHTCSLESLTTSHTLALDRLAKDHDTEMTELDLKLQPMLEEQAHWVEHIKRLEQDHDTQIKAITETHDSSVAAHTEEKSTKQVDMERYQTELDEVRKQLLEVQADLQLKTERRNELQKQLGDAPPPASMNDEPSSSFEQDILVKQNALQALELEIQQLEDKYRRQIEEQNSADRAAIKQNEKTVHNVVIQHQQEIEKMHRHLQHLLDVKDDEINNVSYRLKTVTSSRQKDIDNLQTKQRGKVHSLEEQQKQVKDTLATRTAAYDRLASQQQTFKVKFDQGEQNVAALAREKQAMQSTVATYKAENTHLLQTIHQLQSKMHKIQLG